MKMLGCTCRIYSHVSCNRCNLQIGLQATDADLCVKSHVWPRFSVCVFNTLEFTIKSYWWRSDDITDTKATRIIHVKQHTYDSSVLFHRWYVRMTCMFVNEIWWCLEDQCLPIDKTCRLFLINSRPITGSLQFLWTNTELYKDLSIAYRLSRIKVHGSLSYQSR